MKELLKFITCGSVDDGKSTLIGHMLYDAKLLYTDQKQSLLLDSKIGSRGGEIDYSLLLDGLMAEREQGITIDVAYRYFTTDERSFIVADTPGHEEYTRNMAVGASFADLAVILIDATKGILQQTRRHTRICALMGIRYFIFAVNKMDLTGYDQYGFEEIENDIRQMAEDMGLEQVTVIPVSATEGDNVTTYSDRMDWYRGKSLLNQLESVDIEEQREDGFLLPVQRVCRPNHLFRGYEGQIEAGFIHLGDQVTILPSGEQAFVTKILRTDQEVEEANAGMPVTICLDKELDVSRGCFLVKSMEPYVETMFAANILWMDDEPLIEGRSYLMKLVTQKLPVTVLKIKYKIDVNTGQKVLSDNVFKNELARCDISLSRKTVFGEFAEHPSIGEFILIDRITNMTSACGTVRNPLRRSKNVIWHPMDITRELRAEQLRQKPCTIWFTGLSGSGKSVIANALEQALVSRGKHTMLLDGDNIRMGINRDLGFDVKDRVENIRRIAEISKLINDAGLIVLTSFISPYRSDRRHAREIIGEENFIEIHLNTPLAVCESRDPKGLYRKARAGEIPNFTGINSPYEEPESPALAIDTSKSNLTECVEQILKLIEERI